MLSKQITTHSDISKHILTTESNYNDLMQKTSNCISKALALYISSF